MDTKASKVRSLLEVGGDLAAEVKRLQKELDREKQLGRATLAHSKTAEKVAVQQSMNKINRMVVPILKEIDEFEKYELDAKTQKMLFNVFRNLKNALRSCGVNVR